MRRPKSVDAKNVQIRLNVERRKKCNLVPVVSSYVSFSPMRNLASANMMHAYEKGTCEKDFVLKRV